MNADNCINGVYANENPYQLKRILYGELGIDDVVVTDWGGSKRVTGLIVAKQVKMPFSAGLTDTTFSHDQIPYRVMRSLDYLQRERMRQRRNHSGLCEQTWQCGVRVNTQFFLQRKTTFKANNNAAVSAILYAIMVIGVYFVQLFLPTLLRAPLVALIGVTLGDLAMKLLNMTVSMLIQFPLNKYVIMRNRSSGDAG